MRDCRSGAAMWNASHGWRRYTLMNPKALQYIMGHADISVTLNTYTHVKFDDAKDELLRVANA